ncbi:hypothetical protein H2248_007632 [Termitomyces sp. 'cryptogamus']|nr:hypothetical protein H2248_007632 [Termitomyces sp. 'cryptogamus']
MPSAGRVLKTEDSGGNNLRAAPPHMLDSPNSAGPRRGLTQSSETSEKTTAPAAKASFSAPADESDSASAESPLTDVDSDKEPDRLPEAQGMEVDINQNSSENEEDSTTNVYATPRVDNENHLENEKVITEESRRRARNESTNQNEVSYMGLSQEQSTTIEQARINMTEEQRDLVETRIRNVQFGSIIMENDALGTSRNKGKGPDPRNWGEANLSEDELEPDIQEQLLEDCANQQNNPAPPVPDTEESLAQAYENEEPAERDWDGMTREELRERIRQKKMLEKDIRELQLALRKSEKNKKRNKRVGSEPLSDELQEMINRVTHRARGANRGETSKPSSQKLKPYSQVTRDSALGRAFDRMRARDESEPSDSDTSDSSSESSSGYSRDESEGTDPSSENSEDDSSPSESSDSDKPRKKRKEKASRKSKPKMKRDKKVPKSLIKPTPPAKYGGAPDLQAFLQFMTHCTSYVKYGLVQKERQVLVVSEFLTSRAVTFYSQEVSRAPEEWSLERFFKELFNDCFPINYRNKQRNKLQHLRQGKLTVRDYVGELQELFTIVGSTNRKEKVVKLFNGFRTSIQRELYRSGMNPETSKWKKVVAKAEFIEMAESIDLEFGDGPASHHGHRRGRSERQNKSQYAKRQSEYSSGNRRSRSPTEYGKKTNTLPAYSGKGGTSRPSDHRKPKSEVPRFRKMGERKRLSKEEEAEYRAQDKCFKCGNTGHMSRNCLQGKSASSPNPGKPPGLKSYSVKVDLQGTERLREEALGETTAGVYVGMIAPGYADEPAGHEITGTGPDETGDKDSGQTTRRIHPDMGGRAACEETRCSHTEDDHCNMIGLSAEQDYGRDTYGFKVKSPGKKVELLWEAEAKLGRPHRLGSAPARKLEYLLESLQLYRGDPSNALQLKGRRFIADEIEGGKLSLWDQIWDQDFILPAEVVGQRGFSAGSWYAAKCSARSGILIPRLSCYETTLSKDTWAWNAERVLALGAPYLEDEWTLSLNHRKRFELTRLDTGRWAILDRLLHFVTDIAEYHLHNPLFDICRWYLLRVARIYVASEGKDLKRSTGRFPRLTVKIMRTPMSEKEEVIETPQKLLQKLLRQTSYRERLSQKDRRNHRVETWSMLEIEWPASGTGNLPRNPEE